MITFWRTIILFFIFLLATNSFAQTENTEILDSVPIHSPKKATLYSTFLPGLGQVYNKKYWKVPVLYGLFGTFTYFLISNNKQYVIYRQAYRDRVDGYTFQLTEGSYIELLDDDQLKTEMKRWERNRNFNGIGIFLTYIANIIDANVDAHFFDYDISDDLSLHVMPYLPPSLSKSGVGFTCILTF
jgi:hypothetical protein